MKRVFLLAAVVIVASTWARPARAQLGLLNLDRHGDRYPARQPEEPGQEEATDVSAVPAAGRFHASTFQSLGPDPSWCG